MRGVKWYGASHKCTQGARDGGKPTAAFFSAKCTRKKKSVKAVQGKTKNKGGSCRGFSWCIVDKRVLCTTSSHLASNADPPISRPLTSLDMNLTLRQSNTGQRYSSPDSRLVAFFCCRLRNWPSSRSRSRSRCSARTDPVTSSAAFS